MSPGLRFRNVDLHVHTPASQCFTEPGVTPEMLVEAALAARMDAIAITDHNTAGWVDCVRAAAAGTPLTVFPGVEITVQPGVHLLAIFPEDRASDHVTDLLSELGLLAPVRGNQDALVTRYGLSEVIAIASRHGALPILAHIDGPKGAWEELSGQSRVQLWQKAAYAAVEVLGPGLPPEVGKAPYRRTPAFYWASDNPNPADPSKHSHLGIGCRSSRFKLNDPITWESLRLCFQDPGNRILSPGDPPAPHPLVESLHVEGGFLDGMSLEFSPNLNCVIGGRGAGKSCLLELLRFAFDISPKTDLNTQQAQGILGSAFPPGSRLSLRFSLDEGAAYRLERTSGSPPRVFCIQPSGEEEPLDLPPAGLLPLQVYGQKEVYEISRKPDFQLHLLDNTLADALAPLQSREQALLFDLADNAARLLRLSQEIEAAQAEAGGLTAVEEEIRRMEQLGFVSRLEHKAHLDREKDLLQKAQSQVEQLQANVDAFSLAQRLNLAPFSSPASPPSPLLASLHTLLSGVDGLVQHTLEGLTAEIAALWEAGEASRREWQAAYDHQDALYQALLREFQASGQALKLERYTNLQKDQRRLQAKVQEIAAMQEQAASLLETRRLALDDLRRVRRERYEVRCEQAAHLTQALGKRVRITIWPQGQREAYMDQLGDVLYGLRVHKTALEQLSNALAARPERPASQPVQFHGQTRYLVPEIPSYLDPLDLSAAIRLEAGRSQAGDSPLFQDFNVTSEQMRRNISGLSPEKLFELETLCVPDLPIIELQVGRGDLDYKPLHSLSVGQRCTALLSLVLLESPAPLLIDQPEDDLDNHFIFDQIVTTLRSAKDTRQFIIATHNANIPVSGDAELIVVLNADERRGWVEPGGMGSIDTPTIKQSVERILEGGEQAFKIRKEKYGI